MSLITDQNDFKTLKKAGKILAEVLDLVKKFTKEGVNLLDLDRFIEKEIIKRGGRPSFKGFEGYPNTSCLSVNAEIVHSIPKNYTLHPGDCLGIDIGLWINNICVDAAITVGIDPIPHSTKNLLKITQSALNEAIKIAKPGIKVGDISSTIQNIAHRHHLGIVKNLTGHGVGLHVHDDPSIPNYGRPGTGELIKENMVLAIEPMFTLGVGETRTATDGWGVESADKSLAAQFEHTILITQSGCEIITKF